MNRPHDYERQDDELKERIYDHVRIGGPKERRISHSFLNGHLERRHFHYFKVTQELVDAKSFLSLQDIRAHFQDHYGDIGDVYQPLNETGQPWDFYIVGLYKELDAHRLLLTHDEIYEGVHVTADFVKDWFIELYPNPVQPEVEVHDHYLMAK